ncbi:UPF0481 protein At3g47200-like isoform X1 [Prosopis cineraria]|uniref:UPF0481 protein At3g47200-like isoform X1 n=1 Tax=Prosopis cineraria TaxID=364024 RepID=UPI00240F3792|nr:UPF0481 protein At3g47200-like isoform X1 [Prosopis cineraria]
MEDDEIMIDINAIMTKNRDEDGLSSRLRCIYRVPPMIRHLKRQAYTPQVVSIGPFHHGDKRLKDMERHKEIVFKRFVEKSAMVDLDTLVNFAKQSELKVRASYSENINLSKKDLVKLILVDAAFIIELFRMSYERVPEIFKDAKLSQLKLREAVYLDLLLLENQLPFFFLEELFNIAFPIDLSVDCRSFLELTYSYFCSGNIQSLEPHSNIRIKHFTDLLRLFYLPERKSIRHGFKGDRSDFPSYSANELQEAGVKLKKSTSKCLLNLKFSRPVLEIPQIHVDDATETLFRNMIALEQCHYPYESYFVDYIFALDCLVNTNKDVEVLTHKKIIENWLGDADEVAALFNGLGKNIGSSDFSVEYLDTWRRLNKFYQDPCHKRLATLRRDYCNTPWRTVASIAGIILLILTIIQTIFSILQVV